MVEAPVELDDARERERIGKDERLASRIALVGRIVLDHALAPDEGIARIVARPVKELAEVHVEVLQERFHAVDVGQRNAEVAAVLLGPHLKAVGLAVAQARSERLAGLKVFVRHGAHRNEAVVLGVHHVARARKDVAPHLADEGFDHLLLPAAREAPAGAEVADLEAAVVGFVQGHADLGAKPLHALGRVGLGHEMAEIDLVDDGKHRDFKENRMKPRAFDGDVDARRPVGVAAYMHVLRLEVKETQELDEVALDEAQPAQVLKLVFAQRKRTQVLDFSLNLLDVGREIDALGAAAKAVGAACTGELMQHALHHGELVEVGVEQGFDDHFFFVCL